jgi:diguanylate cyclase (GGDEF)-like protein
VEAMKSLYDEHIEITHQVKQIIQNEKIVFPAQYGKLYNDLAHSHDIELKPDEFLTHEMLDDKMVRHVIMLTDCTDSAIVAIETQNKSLLESVLIETRKLQEEIHVLQKLVYEDSLTKSYNRKWFDDNILKIDNVSLRECGTLVMIDLNKFKEINDTYGHVVGDKVLVHVVLKLKESGGRVVRYGGDEFIVIFDIKITAEEIQAKIEKILTYFQKIHFKFGEHSFKVSFSYGMAPFKNDSILEKVIELADKAMYRHKKVMN